MTVMPPDIKPMPPTAQAPPGTAASAVHRMAAATAAVAPVALRVSLALTFLWFGGLKVAGASPVADLVVGTVPGVEAGWFVPLLGGFEVALGLALLAGSHPLVLLALVVHLAGTFGVLVAQPEVAFQSGNPLLLTTEGEFVVKNLVLISATLAIAGFAFLRSARGAVPSRGWSAVSTLLVAALGASAGALTGALAGDQLARFADGVPWLQAGIWAGAVVGAGVALLLDRQLHRLRLHPSLPVA